MGLNTSVRVMELAEIVPPADIVTALGLHGDEKVQKAIRVRSYRGVPVSHLTTFVPSDETPRVWVSDERSTRNQPGGG